MNNIGPTKRSADMNEYVELETRLAKANEEIVRLKSYNQKLINSLNAKDEQIKDLKSRDLESAEIVVLLNEYKTLKETAEKLRKENNENSLKYGSDQLAGKYFTPTNVIDAGLNWTKKAVEICNRLLNKTSK